MSYQLAKEAFEENKTFLHPGSNPLEWNDNTGLSALTAAVQGDLARMDVRLARVEQLLAAVLTELRRR